MVYGMPASAAGRADVEIATGVDATGVTVTVAVACELILTGSLGAGSTPLIGRRFPFRVITAVPALVAVIVTGVLPVTFGAVKNPSAEIVPAVADQVTAVFAVPLTRATNCKCA
jgi:hypothetical protein